MLMILNGCYKPATRYEPWQVPSVQPTDVIRPTNTKPLLVDVTPTPIVPMTSPTPDAPRTLPTLRSESLEYTVQSNDTLAKIALAHQVSVAQILAANTIEDPNIIHAGQVFTIPPASANEQATGFKIIPDSELVYGPNSADFDIEGVINKAGGYLSQYKFVMDEGEFSGAEIVTRVANEYSVNPRLLLALLEYRSEWLTNPSPDVKTLDYPMGFADSSRKGLYLQLAWTANALNRGFYLWEINALAVWTLADGTVMRIDPTINAGTAGVQYLMSLLFGRSDWGIAVEDSGFIAAYQSLFGYPFNYAFEPLIPADLEQPVMALPFADGDVWSYTSGPHGGWNDGSAWAALDFAPPGEAMGCFPSSVYVTASADGEIVRSGLGAVVQDIDGDGIEQTGWSILYMHIASEGRAGVGEYLGTGDPVGYASCEGGFSSGTHMHIARRYNGVWISADGTLPFIMDGWVASSTGIEYDGYLSKNGQTIEAWDGRTDFNQIGR
jgi:LasA protease